MKFFWWIVGTLIIVCVVLMFKFGLSPRIIPIVKPSAFENAQDVGRVTVGQLHGYFRTKRVFVVGVRDLGAAPLSAGSPAWSAGDRQFAELFIQGAVQELTTNYQVNVESAGAVPEIGEIRKHITEAHKPEFLMTRLQNFFEAPEVFAAEDVMRFTVLPFRVNAEDPLDPSLLCSSGPDSGGPFGQLLCAADFNSHQVMKKTKLDRHKILVVIEQRGMNQFAIYYHAP